MDRFVAPFVTNLAPTGPIITARRWAEESGLQEVADHDHIPTRRPNMKRKKSFAAGILLASSAVLTSGAFGAGAPLTVLNKSRSSEEGSLSFDLWNTSDKMITAWRLSLAYDDGTGKGRRSVLDQDFALSPVRPGEGQTASPGDRIEGPLLPGEVASAAWEVELPGAGLEHSALSLRAVAVVFEDGSFAGDREASRAILSARRVRLEEMRSALGLLRATRDTGRTRGIVKGMLATKARELREESQDTRLSDGLRREVAAQKSAAKLEVAELLESLEASVTGDGFGIEDRVLERVIQQLEGQVAAGDGRHGREMGTRYPDPERSGLQSGEGVQR
jgi:hypothetical protein